jgi:hypothetical protein
VNFHSVHQYYISNLSSKSVNVHPNHTSVRYQYMYIPNHTAVRYQNMYIPNHTAVRYQYMYIPNHTTVRYQNMYIPNHKAVRYQYMYIPYRTAVRYQYMYIPNRNAVRYQQLEFKMANLSSDCNIFLGHPVFKSTISHKVSCDVCRKEAINNNKRGASYCQLVRCLTTPMLESPFLIQKILSLLILYETK